jgi:hypothetical protein
VDLDVFAFLGAGAPVRIPVEVDDEVNNDLPVLYISNVTSTGLRFYFNNPTDRSFMYGSDYNLFAREGDNWRLLNAGMFFTSEGYVISENSQTGSQTMNWSWHLGELPPGEYMLEKGYNFHRAPGDNDHYVAKRTFVID